MRIRRGPLSVQRWAIGSRRRTGQATALVMAVALTATLADAVRSPQPAPAAPRPEQGTEVLLERPDEAAALVTARFTGRPVKIAGMTTEVAEFFAQPDGTIDSTVYAAPVRMRVDGAWVPVDLTLKRAADGTVRPVAHPEILKITGARDTQSGALATIGAGGEQLAMNWEGKLPEPVLEGNRATYREVLPEVDLVVEATRTGFEQFLVVKTRAAGARVKEVPLSLSGRALASHTRDAAGSLTLKDKFGRVVATSPAPEMWDAQLAEDGETPARRTALRTVTTARPARAAAKGRAAVSGGVDVELAPDTGWLEDPATQFPVTIDPQLAVTTSFDGYIKDGDSGGHSGANDLQIGLLSGTGGKRTRSFINWNTAALRGRQILDATVKLYNFYSTTCSATPWEIWVTGSANASTRWSNQPGWSSKEGTSTQTKGFNSGCGDGWVTISAKSFFQRAATAGWSTSTMGIRASNESATNQFKQFRSRDADDNAQVPQATVKYNSYPVVGARSASPSMPCVTGAGRPYINSLTPQLKAVVSDPDGGKIKATFEWHLLGVRKLGEMTTGLATSGTTLSATVPAGAFADGGSYTWRVTGNDGTVSSPVSSYCDFTVDTTTPGAPSVTSTDYPTGQWAGGTGSAGTFDLGSAGATDVAAYEYGLDVNPPDQSVNAPNVGANATVTITPRVDGAHTLYVRSRDRAGNRSAVTSYTFYAGGAAITAPRDGDLSAGTVAVEGIGSSGTTGVTYQWRRGDTDAWATVPAGDVTIAAGQSAVTWPLAVPAGGQVPKLNWNLGQTVNAAEVGPDPLDGPVQLRGLFVGSTSVPSKTVKLTLDRNRAWSDTEDLDVGSVNLITGGLTVKQSDTADIGRTANTRLADDIDPMFGPGWASSVSGFDKDRAYTNLTVNGSLVQIGLVDGATIGFTKKSGTSFEPQIGMEALNLSYSASGNTYTLTERDGITATFSHVAGQLAGEYVLTAASASGSPDKTTYSWETATVAAAAVARPTMALSASPTGVTCTAEALIRGCRAKRFSYATATTASGTSAAQWGDFAGRVKEITFTAWDPDASPAQMKTVVLARYAYDNNGRLRSAWDPRLDWTESGEVRHVGTSYAYSADGLLTEVRPAGQEPWTFSYTVIPGDAGKGRLAQVSRGIGNTIALTTVVYRVPVSGAGAPYDLSAGQTTRWAQSEPPVQATAMFPPTQVPDGNQANGTQPSSYERALVSYLDANGRIVNGAAPGGFINTQWYDTWGNEIRSLDAANRQRALNNSPSDDVDHEALLARDLSTLTNYATDGSRVTSILEPERDVTLPDDSVVRGRPYTSYTYDEGAPASDEPFDLVTTENHAVRVRGSEGVSYDADKRVTKSTYDWDSTERLTETVDPGGLNLVTRYQIDPVSKQQVSVTTPAGRASGDTPATQRTIYYRAGTGSGESSCDNRPEFADLICQVRPGGQPEAGPTLPTKTLTYDMFGQQRVSTESTSAGILRRSAVDYDTAGRPQRQSVTTAAGLGEPAPTTRIGYDRVTGLATRVQSLDENGAVTAEVVKEFDGLGRLRSYTDASGMVSTNTYDLLNRVTTTNDGRGTRTYAYDGGAERRGLLTSVVDSQAGTYSATYDPGGQVITQQWASGVSVQLTTNEAGEAVGIAYSQAGCPADDCTLFAETLAGSVHGQSRTRISSLSQQDYGYDTAGRLTSVRDTVDATCVNRTFAYDLSTNRTQTASYDSAEDGSCQTGTVTNRITRTYDTADRLNSTGYRYDALGRSLTQPASDSAMPGGGDSELSYYGNGMARKIEQNDRSAEYQLDVIANRYRSSIETRGTATTTKINHFSDDGDIPSWTDEGDNTATRPILGVAGLVGGFNTASGLTSSITNLHGDVVAGVVGTTPGLSYTSDYLEDGQLRDATDTGSRRYGWLGGKQRASDTPNGVSIMGVRLYNPATARFLSVDAVRGGNANDYEYANADPVNKEDLSGNFSCWRSTGIVKNRWRTFWGAWGGYRISWSFRCSFSDRDMKNTARFGIAYGIAAIIAGIVYAPAGAAFALAAGVIGWAWWEYDEGCKRRRGGYLGARLHLYTDKSTRLRWGTSSGKYLSCK